MAANVIIAPQLFSSLGKLAANEQARVIEFIDTFQTNPAHPGVSLERLTHARSKNVSIVSSRRSPQASTTPVGGGEGCTWLPGRAGSPVICGPFSTKTATPGPSSTPPITTPPITGPSAETSGAIR